MKPFNNIIHMLSVDAPIALHETLISRLIKKSQQSISIMAFKLAL